MVEEVHWRSITICDKGRISDGVVCWRPSGQVSTGRHARGPTGGVGSGGGGCISAIESP
ncbi:hypothetical protein ZHAS_00015170 [Anopheles sinensis]|uniref:Uncharacterized protein n=1 Tax=Anopheles sinensis TaxID=74873 RepID=A0A084WA77_ANOSI|nr:hypothetical protein ZHAS_00015170 [Anopheles sinensis]